MNYENIKRGRKVAVFLNAYKAAATLEDVYRALPLDFIDVLFLVDDHSADETYALAQKLGIESFRNDANLGYGGNVKRCLEIALEKGADIAIEMHPDGEYGTDGIIAAVDALRAGSGMVLGNRFTDTTAALRSGMRLWKYIPSVILSRTQTLLLGSRITDLHQGFRVYTRELLERAPFREDANGYIFSFEIIAQCCFLGLSVEQVPVSCRYEGKKRGASFKHSVMYSFATFKTLAQLMMARMGIGRRLFRDAAASRKA